MNNKFFVRTALTIALASAYSYAPVAFAETSTAAAVAPSGRSVQNWHSVAVNSTTSRFVISLDTALATVPPSFRGPDGTYIAIDLPSTSLATGAKQASDTTTQTLVEGIRWAEAGGRTRIVLNVPKGTAHKVSLEGNNVVVTLSSKTDAATPEATKPIMGIAPSAAALSLAASVSPSSSIAGVKPAADVKDTRPASTQSTVALLRDIDYKKVGSANGQLNLDLSDPSIKVRVFREGTNLVVDLPNTALPRNLAKRTRVDQLDTPIQAISPSSSRDGATRILLEARGGWDYTFTQNGSSIALNIIKVSDDYRVGGKKVFTGKKLTLSFQQIEIRTVLQILAEFTGLNIVASDSVSGTTTLRLNDVPWDHALDVVLNSGNLDMRRSGNVITVAPKKEIMEKERQDREERLALEATEPTVTETFQINYHSAEDIKKLLETTNTTSGSSVTAGGTLDSKMLPIRLRADKRSNQLFATGTSAQLDETRDVIRSVDVPGRQVTIEAKIVEISDSFAKNIGVKFGFNSSKSIAQVGQANLMLGSNIDANMGNFGTTSSTSSSSTSAGSSSVPLSVSLPAANINGITPGSFAFTLFNNSLTRFLNLEVSALEADGKAKTVSSPHVVTADNEEAVIKQGTEIPYQQASSSGATSIAFKTAAMVLKVTPQITPNGKVSLKLDVNKDSVGQNTSAGPAIDTKSISTKVLVDNGGTIVIGGIFIQDEQNAVDKIPLLGDLPGVGHAFRSTQKQTTKKELVIMITPRVIDSSGAGGPAQ